MKPNQLLTREIRGHQLTHTPSSQCTYHFNKVNMLLRALIETNQLLIRTLDSLTHTPMIKAIALSECVHIFTGIITGRLTNFLSLVTVYFFTRE